ncbi:MAG: S-layer homology domain-containing protein, partial [Proteocatella sp.]
MTIIMTSASFAYAESGDSSGGDTQTGSQQQIDIPGIDTTTTTPAIISLKIDGIDAVEGEETKIPGAYKPSLEIALDYIGTSKSEFKLDDEWPLLTLSRGSRTPAATKLEAYYQDAYKKITAEPSGMSISDYPKLIMALTSTGKNAANFSGKNLLEKFADYEDVAGTGIFGCINTLMAVNSHNYDIPEKSGVKMQNTEKKMVDYILGQELSSGGWSWSTEIDVDTTAMVIQALAPYYRVNDTKVIVAVDKALVKLSNLQLADGDYDGWGGPSPFSGAQVLVALCEIGKDPLNTEGFTKEGASLIDGILKYQLENGGFKASIVDSAVDSGATVQSTYALVAYDRFKNSKTGLYDMSDLQLNSDAIIPGSGNGSSENGGNSESGNATVMFSIDKKNINKGYVLSPAEVKINKGDTVWNVTKSQLDSRGISYKSSGSGNSIYLKSIAGDGEFDHGSNSGWMYLVNGEASKKVSSQYVLDGGETVQWRYTTNLGGDVGQDNSSWGGTDIATAETKGVIKPKATITNGEAKAQIEGKVIDVAVREAADKKLSQILIEPEVDAKTSVNKVSVVLEKESIAKISSQTKAILKLKTSMGDIIISNKAMALLLKEKGNTVTMSVISNKDGSTGFEIKAGLDTVSKIASGITAVIPVAEASSSTVAVQMMPDGSEKIFMKSIIDAKYLNVKLDGSATIKVTENKKTYADTTNHWAKDAIEFAGARGILKGTSADKFSPDATMTKGMLVTLLHRFENEQLVQGKAYDDVKSDAYYANAAAWAQVKGIAEGESDTQFQPNKEVTREQLATMIYNYAKSSGEDVSVADKDKIKTFEDWNNTSQESQEAMKYCYNNNIIGGKSDTTLDPQGKTTRAEVSAIIQRFLLKTTV